MPECKKYKSAIVSFSHEEFVQNVAYSLTLYKDENYQKLLQCEAFENSWLQKSKDISDLINLNLNKVI